MCYNYNICNAVAEKLYYYGSKEDHCGKGIVMKMKKTMLAAVIAMLMSFTACGTTENSKETENEAAQVTEAETEAPETEELTEAAEEITEAAAIAEPEEFTPVEGLSENYADLENRCFAYNGEIFTLGESTLKDLIDGGIPFKESELNNKGNNVNSNYETNRYDAQINDFVSMQFTFINITESNITEEECLLSNVRWYSIYVPQPDYEDSLNEEIINYINDAANYVCFSFPLTLTKEQLLENNSDTTEVDEYNNVKYRVDSEVYMGSSGYTFEFNKNTNQLEDVTISWLP